jgi:hypothetical protein
MSEAFILAGVRTPARRERELDEREWVARSLALEADGFAPADGDYSAPTTLKFWLTKT